MHVLPPRALARFPTREIIFYRLLLLSFVLAIEPMGCQETSFLFFKEAVVRVDFGTSTFIQTNVGSD